MSHITKVDIQVKDLKALAAAAKHLGLVLDLEATQFRYYQGQMAKCEGKISIANPTEAEAKHYEIGLTKNADGSYSLLTDEFAGGKGMVAKVGRGLGLLKQRYAVEVAKTELRKKGLRVTEKAIGNGKVKLIATR